MFCRKCGNRLEDDWIVCPSCGEPQKHGDIQQTSPGPVKKWWIAAGAGVIFLVLIMALLGTLIMLGSQMPDNTDGSESDKTALKEAVKEDKTELTETAAPKRKSKKKAASAKKAENGVAADTAVQSKTAEEKTAEALRSEYIFPDSSTRYLSEEEVRSKDASQLLIGRNEIFARYGYIFEMEELKTHFGGTSWYKGKVPGNQFDGDAVFNDFEKKNIELIKRVEDEINGTAASQQNTQEGNFSIPAGTYVNNQIFSGWQALITVNYTSVDWFEVSIFTEPYMNTATFYGGKVDERTIQVTAEGTGITLTLHWENDREMTVTRSGEFTGTDSSMFNDMTNTNYTLAPGF